VIEPPLCACVAAVPTNKIMKATNNIAIAILFISSSKMDFEKLTSVNLSRTY
jgi:hypothetical protein